MTDSAIKQCDGGRPIAGPLFRRRGFLKLSLLGTGGALAGFSAARLRPKNYGKYRGLQSINAYQADVVYAFGDAILPHGKGFPSLEQANVVARLDEELFFVNEAIRSDFIAAVMLVEMLPIRFGYWSRFSRMSRAKRLNFLERAQSSGHELVNVVILAIAVMVRYVYYGHPSSWAAIGYDGPYGHLPQKLSEQRKYYRRLSRSVA